MLLQLSPDDFYLTISKSESLEIKIKGSKFIGFAFPVQNKQEAEELLEKHRKQFYDATHNCFAYSIGLNDDVFRFSDDGEPSGTAGKPIYQAIKHFDYKNILVVVTRYFGGTKLGVGPLARAYYDTAFEVLKKCEQKIEYKTRTLELQFDYTQINIIKRILEPYAIETKEDYADYVHFRTKLLQSKFEFVFDKIHEATQGRCFLKELK